MGKHEARLEELVAQYPDFKNGDDKALCETTLKCEELGINDSDENREKCFEIACVFFEVIRLNELDDGGYKDF